MRAAHIAAFVRKEASKGTGRAILLDGRGSFEGGDQIVVDDRIWRVVRADSPLAVRSALISLEDDAEARLVILTSVGQEELGWDVRARVVRQRVHSIRAWDLVRELFRARVLDPRVARLHWLGELLLEQAPPNGYPPAPGGVLDVETAWGQLLGSLLGFSTGVPDALLILRWSAREGTAARWRVLSPGVRAEIVEHFALTAGSVGASLAAAMSAGQPDRLVALGLVCDVLWTREAADALALVAARTRMEPLVGGSALTDLVAREWADLALRVLSELSQGRAHAEREIAEAILTDLRAQNLIDLSGVLPGSATARARAFGETVERWLRAEAEITDVYTAHERWLAHTRVDRDRAGRAMMALRLIRALAQGERDVASPMSFGDRVTRHVGFSSWVDLARTALLGGDVDEHVDRAYRGLLTRARGVREVENHHFAEALAAWSVLPNREPALVPVEHALADVAVPVAKVRPVLILVLDGLDLVVWRQLWDGIAAAGWTLWRRSSMQNVQMGIAVLPSITSISRASLLAGSLKQGSQTTEKSDFAAHPNLCTVSATGRPPVLFHKAELVEETGGGLASRVRTAVADRQQRVVGVVLNVVDDWLAKSDQLRPRWSIDKVPLLESLLAAASLAERAVVVLSDHGHLLEYEMELRYGGEHSRWRPAATGPVREGEVLVSGPRVRGALGANAAVLLCTEALRYTPRKAGYHGGATAQEVIAPIAVISQDELGVEGWEVVVDSPPDWWGDAGLVRAPDARHTAAERPGSEPLGEQRQRPQPMPIASAGLGTVAQYPRWIAALQQSPAYRAQRELAGRTAPADQIIRAFLFTLHAHQWRAPRFAVAAAIGQPEIRLRGVLAGIRRVLNIEGFAVVEEEDATGTLHVNHVLLARQFGIEV